MMKKYSEYINEDMNFEPSSLDDLETPYNMRGDFQENTNEFLEKMKSKYDKMFLGKKVKLHGYIDSVSGGSFEIRVSKISLFVKYGYCGIVFYDERGHSYSVDYIMSVKNVEKRISEDDPYGEEDWNE
jgi:hypothetical protein